MRRTGGLAVLWVLATVGAVAVGQAAISVVSDEVAPRSVAPLSRSAVSDAVAAGVSTTIAAAPDTSTTSRVLRTSTTTSGRPGGGTVAAPDSTAPATTPSTPAPSPSSTSTTSVTAVTRSYSAQGGTVTVRFSCGTTSELVSASPAAGFTMEVKDDGPEHVEVEFERDDPEHESRIRARCANGQPSAQVEEG